MPLCSVLLMYYRMRKTVATWVELGLLQYLLIIENVNAIFGQVIVIAYIRDLTADKY